MKKDIISIGEYIIIQKHNYRKIHKLNKIDSCVSIGKDNVDLSGITRNPYFSVYKMIPKGSKKRKEYSLELAEELENLKSEIDVKSSGSDNRNIIDDGRSQKLTAAEIEELKCDANKASDIVEKLISNSNTFHNKTEFSQQKYLKKKEKKYFEFIQVLKPNIRLVAEILYRLDPSKIQGIRMDTLSQIITLSNISSEGNHLLYDSGSNGLLAAALLSAIGSETNGKLVHMHPGNMSQKQALLALNFPVEQYNRCISVNVYSVLRQIYQGCDTHDTKSINKVLDSMKRKLDDNYEVSQKCKVPKLDENSKLNEDDQRPDKVDEDNSMLEPKKPKWHFDNIEASEILHKKVDSLVIACREDALNIFNELITFVKPGRPFVIYYSAAEPLQKLYVTLRSQPNIAALKLTCNWMRNYQILPERTHPDVMMNNASGFLLTGYVLK